jgi:hypothetical protein
MFFPKKYFPADEKNGRSTPQKLWRTLLFHSDLPQAMIAGVQGDVIQSTTSSMFAH